jgi:hypothetical protein
LWGILMVAYESHFIRENQLDHLYQAVREEVSPPLIVTGPLGVGKTSLLRNLYRYCLKEDFVVPIYCSCLSNETITCSLTRIEQAVVAQGLPKLQEGKFESFLLNKIGQSLRLVTWEQPLNTILPTGEKEIYAISLLERNIDPNGNFTYQISPKEAKADFSATLNSAASLVNSSQRLLLIVDCDYSLNAELLDILISSVRASQNIKIVAATDSLAESSMNSDPEEFDLLVLTNFSQRQIENLVSKYWPEESPVVAQQLWQQFGGAPLLTDTFLQLLHKVPQHPIDDIPGGESEQYNYLSLKLYSQAQGELRSIIEALSILHQGASPTDLAAITGLHPERIIKTSQNESLIDIFPTPEANINILLDLYHPLFKNKVSSFIPTHLKGHLHQRVGNLYIQRAQIQSPLLSPPDTIISVPSFFRGYNGRSFVDSVIRTLPLSLLVGDIKTTKDYLDEALEICRKENITQEPTLLNGISILCLEEKDINGAVVSCLQALDVVRQKPHQHGFIENTILSNLAFLLQLQGKLSEALYYALTALSISQRLYVEYGYQGSLSATLSNVGLLYEKMGSFESSLKYYESALEVDERTNNNRGMAIDLRRIGTTLQELGKVDRAIEIHSRTLEIDKALHDLQGMASDYGNLGVAYYLRGDHERSLSLLIESLDLFNQIKAKEEAAQVQRLISEITSKFNANSS